MSERGKFIQPADAGQPAFFAESAAGGDESLGCPDVLECAFIRLLIRRRLILVNGDETPICPKDNPDDCLRRRDGLLDDKATLQTPGACTREELVLIYGSKKARNGFARKPNSINDSLS